MTLLILTKKWNIHLWFRGKKKVLSLPPGMKSRNPGTKKIALETPVRTHLTVTAYSGDPNPYLYQCYNATKK